MSIEAMKQAVEALNYLQGIVDTESGPKAAEALRAAIEQAQEPQCAHGIDQKKCGWCWPRQWQGLTTEDAKQLVEDRDWYNDPVSFCFEVEAKLKEKNT